MKLPSNLAVICSTSRRSLDGLMLSVSLEAAYLRGPACHGGDNAGDI